MAAGRSNAVGSVTLATGASTTTVTTPNLRRRLDADPDASFCRCG
jgi:hypothetical protein